MTQVLNAQRMQFSQLSASLSQQPVLFGPIIASVIAKIPYIPSVSSLDGTESLVVVQGGSVVLSPFSEIAIGALQSLPTSPAGVSVGDYWSNDGVPEQIT